MERLDGIGKTQATKKSTRFSDILKQKASQTIDDVENQIIKEEVPASSQEEVSSSDTFIHSDVAVSLKQRKKIAKRGNPEYTQALFWLSLKTSRRLDRELLNLSDVGKSLDRSELVEQLLNIFYSVSEKIGSDEALHQLEILKDKYLNS